MDKLSLNGFAKLIRQELPEYKFVADVIDIEIFDNEVAEKVIEKIKKQKGKISMKNNKNNIGIEESDDPTSPHYWNIKKHEKVTGLKLWEYEKRKNGNWYALTPGGPANLGGHEVIEHDGGTITVSPSILIGEGTDREWHGFLKNGIWREC